MSHLLEAWLDASRAGNAELAASLAEASVSPYARPVFSPAVSSSKSSVTVMVVEEKPLPVRIRPTELAPSSIIPPVVLSPTIVLVGDGYGGGDGIPWSNGPGALMNEAWPLGTMMFYVGRRLGVSIGIYDQGKSLENLIISKHMRNVNLRVHTGITKAGDAGQQHRDDPGLDDWGYNNSRVPMNRPQPPSGGPGNAVEEFQEFAKQFDEPYMRWAPDLSPGQKFVGNLKDLFKFFTPNDANPFSWFQ